MTSSIRNNNNNKPLDIRSVIVDRLLDDRKTQEVFVMEYEKVSPIEMNRQLRLKAKKQGNCIIPNWLALILGNISLVLFCGLLTATIMLALNPPGVANTITAMPLKYNQSYNAHCFSFDNSCDQSRKLWCINNRCQCYDQLAYWDTNRSLCAYCPSTYYYNGSSCTCLVSQYRYSTGSSTSCQYYRNITQNCNSLLLCNEKVGLNCIGSTCQCLPDYYWNSTTSNTRTGSCVRYSSNTQPCNATSNCSPNTALACVNGVCQCPSSGAWYWTGSKCIQIKTFNQSCTTNEECDDSLKLVCNGNVCRCSGPTSYGSLFWNGTQCVICPTGWLNYQIYCYYPNPTPATWTNSRIYCQRYGGDLLVIKDQIEFDFIGSRSRTILGPSGLTFVGYYTNSTVRPGLFNWVDLTMPLFSATGAPGTAGSWWCGGQPNFVASGNIPNIQACGAMSPWGSSMCMNDRWCWEALAFTCKKSQ